MSAAISLASGSVRAVQLLRMSTKVDAVNAAVLTTLANGRGDVLSRLLNRSGSALYLSVARSISEPLEKLLVPDPSTVPERLQQDARTALMAANRALKRHAWLDSVSLAALILAGAGALTAESSSAALSLAALAATLLWLSNVYAARSVATRMFAGAMALLEGLLAGLEQIRTAHAEKQPSPSTTASPQ